MIEMVFAVPFTIIPIIYSSTCPGAIDYNCCSLFSPSHVFFLLVVFILFSRCVICRVVYIPHILFFLAYDAIYLLCAYLFNIFLHFYCRLKSGQSKQAEKRTSKSMGYSIPRHHCLLGHYHRLGGGWNSKAKQRIGHHLGLPYVVIKFSGFVLSSPF